MRSFTFTDLALAIVLTTGLVGTAWADDPRVPQTGAEQGEFVPHALPGEDIHHPGGPPTLTAPTGLVPQTAWFKEGLHGKPG